MLLDADYSCEPYAGGICQDVSWASDLIFVNKTVKAQGLENSVKKFLDVFNGSECRRAIIPLVCGLTYPPCDKSSDLKRPRHVCKEYCEYVRDQACRDQWNSSMNLLTSSLNINPVPIPDCDALPSKNGSDSPTCVVGISNYTGELGLSILYSVQLYMALVVCSCRS